MRRDAPCGEDGNHSKGWMEGCKQYYRCGVHPLPGMALPRVACHLRRLTAPTNQRGEEEAELEGDPEGGREGCTREETVGSGRLEQCREHV